MTLMDMWNNDAYWGGYEAGQEDSQELLIDVSEEKRQAAKKRYSCALVGTDKEIWSRGYVDGFKFILAEAGKQAKKQAAKAKRRANAEAVFRDPKVGRIFRRIHPEDNYDIDGKVVDLKQPRRTLAEQFPAEKFYDPDEDWKLL